MLKALKNLESMSLEELVGTLKDHEQELYMTKVLEEKILWLSVA